MYPHLNQGSKHVSCCMLYKHVVGTCTALILQSLFSCGRSGSDFEFSLGSFSLLEEITTGQKWANFLNPNQSAASDNQRPSEQLKISPDLHDSSQSSVILNHQGGVNNQWRFRSTEASPVWDYSMAQISPEHFLPASMDVSEGKQQQQYVHREADQSEPMEHGHTQVVMQSGGSVQRRRPPSFVQVRHHLLCTLIHCCV